MPSAACMYELCTDPINSRGPSISLWIRLIGNSPKSGDGTVHYKL